MFSDETLKAIFDFANRFGVFAVIVCFFIWRGDVRETELRKEIQDTSSYVRETLTKALSDSTMALGANTAVLQKLSNATLEMNESHRKEISTK